ncbi:MULTISPECIES: OmpH family outer membrane protein [Parachlamydia]|jgi:outer membrane protein|uniref:Skp-like protein n=2 Tax=Parachlamydia acanthamoebae TaxID=83552 RepID=F8KYJ0_PARAV|nr:OmpH family outer membrane protein [Parachlamydia acanthamoebae]EFB42359.1 hypothetical protein pah_c010o060 [Parachlamydia acanthamoebae str. Hall's coccus]KIA78347.1 Skp-like protein [Parachlamydia acanthamoebae]CCB85942.1 skp-like protein [Parachlamydia acanthamoebae UV-7]
MKNIRLALVKMLMAGSIGFILCAAAPATQDATSGTSFDKTAKIAVVNFKVCIEKSKIGKHEQTVFESLKKQMENSLQEKEKSLNEIAAKLSDPDYVDSLSNEAENELKHKYRTLNQEITQYQNQYYQALSQTNMKIVQQLQELIAKASETVAKEVGVDIVLNEESSFFYKPEFDLTDKVIDLIDKMSEADIKASATN